MQAGHRGAADGRVVEVTGPAAPAPWLVVCEHASAAIPADLGDLGLTPEARFSHVAWDPGALEVARHLAAALRAPLVAACVSRLVYDPNRPPEAPDAIPETSEIHPVPGNRGLTLAQRAARVARVHDPFHAALAGVVGAATAPPVLVTVHSFTAVYRGVARAVELGILHDRDARLADALLAQAEGGRLAGLSVARNAPYGPGDGVTYTLCRHALPHGYLNVMIEIRNDLIATEPDRIAVAAALAEALRRALAAQPERAADTAPVAQHGKGKHR